MPIKVKAPDAVTTEYIEAQRLGVLVRTPLNHIAFFKAEHKAVVAHTKNNGAFVLQIPMHKIEATLKGLVTSVHRSYLVMNDELPGRSRWRTSTGWRFEVVTSVRVGDRLALVPHTIPIARRVSVAVRKLIEV